jgi:thioesterase domain-containing protein
LVVMVDPSAPNVMRGLGLRLAAASHRLRAGTTRGGTAVLQQLRLSAAPAVEQELDIVDQKLVAYLDRAADAYRPRPYAGKVLLMTPVRARTAWLADPVAGWRALAPRASVHRIPGDHVTMLRDEGATAIAERISAALAED